MRTYLFWATVRVLHEGKFVDAQIIEGASGTSEFEARRKVLDRLLNKQAQVVRLDPFQHSIKGAL